MARRVLLLGRRRRLLLQPSSQRRAAPGVRSTFSCSFPHAAPREGSFAHAHAPPDRTLPRKDKKFGKQSERGGKGKKLDRGAQTWESPPSCRRGRGGQTPAAQGQLSSSGEAPQPAVRAGRLASLEPTPRPWAGDCSGPSSHFGSPGRG